MSSSSSLGRAEVCERLLLAEIRLKLDELLKTEHYDVGLAVYGDEYRFFPSEFSNLIEALVGIGGGGELFEISS